MNFTHRVLKGTFEASTMSTAPLNFLHYALPRALCIAASVQSAVQNSDQFHLSNAEADYTTVEFAK